MIVGKHENLDTATEPTKYQKQNGLPSLEESPFVARSAPEKLFSFSSCLPASLILPHSVQRWLMTLPSLREVGPSFFLVALATCAFRHDS